MSREICHDPLGPMEMGSYCEKCGHHSVLHSDDGPCARCEIQIVLDEMRELAESFRKRSKR
jgi:hypothetical protein